MMDVTQRAEEAAGFIRRQTSIQPRMALILGTGLGHLAMRIGTDVVIPYDQIPHFAKTTAPGHTGRLLVGQLRRCPIVAMQGRFHYYEGYSTEQIVLPILTMRKLGAELLVVSNAAGGLNPKFVAGDLMVLTDHVNLLGALAPRLGQATSTGRSAPLVKSVYCPTWVERALAIARHEGFQAQQGVYVAVPGPNYETRAEYRMMRQFGDVVGMSTAPETTAAAAAGMQVMAMSVVTNVASPDAPRKVSSSEVLDAAKGAASNLERLVRGVATHVRNTPLDSLPTQA
jgi:purine-nucleoside phosphorylase